ncbi:MAG: motility associated factor glycosyltransferase family protein [Planctomycetes bacterium]|nr:motility associated factor glycosyltransferase family protein [Planctomycetota bacterium]
MTGRQAPIPGNDMFLHNMRALWRADPRLALRVDAIDDDDRIPLEPTRSNAATATVTTPDGKNIYLHSRFDPVDEAEKFAASIATEEKYCFVMFGMGLGYHVRELYNRLRGDAAIICFESSIPLLATALNCVDLEEPIRNGRLIIFNEVNKAELHGRLQTLSTLIMLGTQFVTHPPSQRAAPDAHERFAEAMTEFVTYSRMTLTTMVSNAWITCRNIAMNLVHYVSTPPIDILKNRFDGVPGIVIAAGPSLSRNMDQLADLKGRAVLCAVQTVLKPLLNRGIVPDFVTSLDFHEMSRKFFEDVGDLRETHLVAEPKATWHVLDGYPGPVSLLDNAWARLVIGDELGARGGLPAGATVAHVAFYLAVYMGCDPIIFVGQDLAFTGHVFYVPGVEIHHAWQSELNRFQTMEHKEWDRIVRNRPILRKVKGQDGHELYTDELLFTYLEQFEKDISAVKSRVINATEGGAIIRGTTNMTLRSASQEYCREPIDPSRFAYRQDTRWRDNSRLDATAKEIERCIEELDEVIVVCDELLELLGELEHLTDDPDRFNQRLVRVDELRTTVQQKGRAYQIVALATQLAEFRRYSADRRIGVLDDDAVERAKHQLARDKDFIGSVRQGAVDVKPVLTESLARIRAASDES